MDAGVTGITSRVEGRFVPTRWLLIFLTAVLLAEWAVQWWPWQHLQVVFSSRRSDVADWGPWLTLTPLGFYFALYMAPALVAARLAWSRLAAGGVNASGYMWMALAVYAAAQITLVVQRALAPASFGAAHLWIHVPLAALFKILAALAIYRALARPADIRRPSMPSGPAEPVAGRHGFRTVIAVALALNPVIPLWDILARLTAVDALGLKGLGFELARALVMLALAWAVLRAGTKSGVFAVRKDFRTAKIAYRLVVAFLLLTPVAFILSAIPYGGGYLPSELKLLVRAAQLLGLLTLYRMLVAAQAPTPDGPESN